LNAIIQGQQGVPSTGTSGIGGRRVRGKETSSHYTIKEKGWHVGGAQKAGGGAWGYCHLKPNEKKQGEGSSEGAGKRHKTRALREASMKNI